MTTRRGGVVSNWRNRLAWLICAWVLNNIADETYRSYIGGAVRYGASQSELDVRMGRDPLGLDGEA